MNIVFRVDSSIKIGAGHLMRCLTLADELKKQNYKITFICRGLEGNLIDLVSKKHKVIILPINTDFQSNNIYLDWLGSTQEQDAQQVIKVMPKNTDLLIIDNYALDKKWHQKLRKFTKKIMVIDDLANREFVCDILLNQNLGVKKEDYQNKVLNDCQLLLGCEYALLRPEFSKMRDRALAKRKTTTTIKNILISIGGSDIDNITYDILQNIDNEFNIIVVLGKTSPHNQMIKKYVKNNDNKNIKVIINANNMSELMFNADLAIGAGGSTSWERCCLGLPTLLYITADNQQRIASNLEQLGAVKIIKELKNDLQNIIDDFDLWQKMSNQAQSICDGLGVKRIKTNVIY